MVKILVCGAKGQLGSSLKDLESDYSQFQFYFTDVEELDILDVFSLSQYVKTNHPDYIINCAAFTAVDKAETEKEKAFQLNAEAVKNLLSAADLCQSKLFHISTDYVFNGRNHIPYKENDITDPDSVYGMSKLKAELYLQNAESAIVIRTSWLYSQHGHNFLKTVLRMGSTMEEIRMVFDQIGTPTFARDLGDTILKIITKCEENPENFISGIYHYSNEGVASWFDFASEIVRLRGFKTKVHPIETFEYPLPAPRPQYSVLNKKKIKDSYSIEIPHWKDSLIRCLEYIP